MGDLRGALRRALAVVVAVLVAGGLLVTTTTPAAADVAPIAARPASAVTADALPTVQINGVVWDQVIVGDTVYAGGQFTSARPAGSPAGTNETPRSNLLAYNIRTGVLITTFAPVVNAQVKSLAVSPDGSKLYIAGSFTTVNGINRYRIASFSTATGALTSFQPSPNSTVNGLAVTDTAVYAGGVFTKVGSADRLRLAAFNPTSGALLGWAPTADSTVQAVLPTPDKSRILVAGSFANLNGSTATGLGAIDATTAATLPWAANTVIRNYGTSASMLKLRTDGTTVYAVGYWYGGTGDFEGVLAADPNSGAVKWLADCHGDTYDVTPMNDVVYDVSHWHYCSNIGGFPDTNPRNAWYHATAVTKQAQGTVAHNGQGGYYDYYGTPAPAMVNWYPTLDTGTFTGQSQAAWSATSNSQYLVLGGEFPKVNGTAQQGLVRFAIPSIAPKKQGPRVSGAAFNPTLLAVRPDQVRIKWTENYDRDDQDLTYALTRVGTATPIYTATATSQFWTREPMAFTDTGLTPGQTYKYRLAASDPDGNTVQSEIVSITMPTSVDPYVSKVIDDGAADYWRLNGTGSTQVDYAGSSDLANDTGATSTTPGALSTTDAALAFDGSSAGQAGTTRSVTGPTTFSAEAWFSTTSTTGGKLLGFGGSSTGTSGSYDRQVYLDNDGKVLFGVYPGSVQTIRSPKAYNDGSWHHVVAELSSAGMVLYVDGLKVASNPGVTTAQEYAGFWRVGGDNLSGWTDQPSSNNFTGTIDEVAIYPTALTGAQVRDHYTASGRTLAVPAVPTDAYGAAVYHDDPAFFWRLNEASGTTATDVSANGADGTYAGGVSYRTASPVADPGYAATFNGTDATVASNATSDNPSDYSEEIWFDTTSTTGGKLIGFGDAQSGTSTNYDRHVYMDTSGALTFGTWTGQANLITSAPGFNDGKWHHLVATQSSTDGMKLYLDGALVGTNPQTSAQAFTGYWRIGGDSSWCCGNFFAGALDEAAVYSSVLTAAQVKAHYDASPAAVNTAPVAAFTSTCTDGACAFDGSTSADADGTVAGYAWDFGDGQTSTNATPNHGYPASGSYDVTLTVTDNKGATNAVTHPVTVTVPPANQKPTAAFTSACTEWSCAFDASTSTDPDGQLASYAWTFGDGTTSTEAAPTHVYTADGSYAVKLTVTDDRAGTDSVTKTVTVHKNAVPVATFKAGCTELACTFDSTGTSDPDGTIATYAWTFGDGAKASTANPAYSYAAPGTYPVTLTVTDDAGATSTVSRNVTVAKNASPVADFTSTCSNLVCSFDGSASTDADGTVSSYAWSFGDGSGTGKTASHTYTAAGSYSVVLTVTDNSGATDTKTRSVTVTAPVTPAGPIAADTFSRTVTKWGTADTGGAWTYSGSTFSSNGSVGRIALATAGTSATASLNAVSARDVNVVTDFAVDKAATGAGTYNSLLVRRNGTSDYRVAFQELTGGKVKLTISKTVAGTSTVLKQVSLTDVTYSPGDKIRVRFTAKGNGTTALTAKAWKVGATEPATAQVTTSDTTASLQAAGSFAVISYLAKDATTAPVTVSVDNLLITAS